MPEAVRSRSHDGSVPLREFLKCRLEGWQELLPPTWRAFLGDVALDFQDMPEALTVDSPFALAPPIRSYAQGSGEHTLFKAFADVSPASVRVVVLGQDPYPKPGQATGRSFEDGLLEDWSRPISPSLRRIRRATIASRLEDDSLLPERPLPWNRFKIRTTKAAGHETMREWFDRMEKEGVLFANLALTLTKYRRPIGDDQKAHIALWRPFVRRVAERLASRRGGAPVYLLLGDIVQVEYEKQIVPNIPGADTWHFVARAHPASTGFLGSNVLDEVNAHLGRNPIPW